MSSLLQCHVFHEVGVSIWTKFVRNFYLLINNQVEKNGHMNLPKIKAVTKVSVTFLDSAHDVW